MAAGRIQDRDARLVSPCTEAPAPALALAASLGAQSAESWAMPTRQQKITFGDMRASGVHGILVYCSDYKCSHSTPISADRWPNNVRLSDIESRFICHACGQRGADVHPDWNSAEACA
jgi:hypothetical protein